MEAPIPKDRKHAYQAHFKYQVTMHMYSCRMLSRFVEALNCA